MPPYTGRVLSRALDCQRTSHRTVITITDLTERRRAQAAITRLELIAASVDEAIIIHTPDGIITSWNQAAERIYGYVEEEVVGRHVSIIHPPAISRS